MNWLFKSNSGRKRAQSVAPREIVGNTAYVSRPDLEAALAGFVARGENLVLYGPSHQGKTMLLTRQMPSDTVVIECRPDFRRAQIYRVIMSSVGYAVLTEKKRSGKASTTVKLGVGVFGGEANAEGGLEQTLQPVTVDLKNSSEVALLVSRIKNLPWIVLNNFQLLDSKTKQTLLFDMVTFADRPGMRILIVGSWPNEDYLEELEPALAGRFRYLEVPMWSDDELRKAAAQWTSNAGKPRAENIKEFVELAGGDISLFRTLVDVSISKSGFAGKAGPDGSPAASVQDMVVGRFRRGLSSKIQAIFAERDSYVGYVSMQPTTEQTLNPKFTPVAGLAESDYLKTSINPETGQRFADGAEVPMDKHKNAQYIEQTIEKPVSTQVDIVRYLFRQFHAAVKKETPSIDIDTLVKEFGSYQTLKPTELDASKLRAALLRFGEVQREALVVPALLNVSSTGQTMEITDRRLLLFLKGIDIEDLMELLDEAQPAQRPSPRRRNQISLETN
jgi:hypothetical protein